MLKNRIYTRLIEMSLRDAEKLERICHRKLDESNNLKKREVVERILD